MGEGGVGIPRGLRTPLLGSGDGGGGGGGGDGGGGGSSMDGSSLRTFRYLCRAATYSFTLRSSSSDDSRRVSDNCRLLPVLATASAGLCRRLYSLSNSSRRTSFLVCCITLAADRPVRTVRVQEVPRENHLSG